MDGFGLSIRRRTMRKSINKTLCKYHVMKNIIVNGSGCWVWCGYKDKKGYGQIHRLKRGWPQERWVHRMAYRLWRDEEIPRDLEVHHICYNCSCCNPDHLVLRTKSWNTADANSKRRGKKPLIDYSNSPLWVQEAIDAQINNQTGQEEESW